MNQSKTPHVHVVLNAPKAVAAFVAFGHNVHDLLAANGTLFPSLPVPLGTLAAQLVDLDAKQTLALTRAVGAVAARNAAHTTALLTLNAYRAYVEHVANADPTNAAEIAKKAGMALSKKAAHQKSDLAVKHVASGEVKVTAKVVKGSRSHEWQLSTDGGKTWSDLPPTAQGTASVKNLSPGSTATFRHRVVLKTGPSDWSQAVAAIVI